MATIIIDTGPLVALLDRDEQDHAWAAEQVRQMEGPLLTCDAVLTEAFFLVSESPSAQRALHALLQRKSLVANFSSADFITHIVDLMTTYQNVPMSFADACLVCLVESHPHSHLFTLDRDFTIYRQHRRRVIPLIAPF